MLHNLKNHIVTYPTPYNITYFWSFGFLAGFVLFNQILTGLFLAMYYMNTTDNAFDSVEFIMRNVNYGWFIRYLHSNGASIFFIILYLHIGKALYYKSYMYPRQNIWYSGMIIFILVMGTSFLGYVLPWGQMSFWGATVITSLVTVIPFIGENLVNWIWGGYSVGNPTLMRFFVIHYLLPFIILAFVMIHLILLHIPGSSNPLNFDKKNEKIKFFPSFYFKDFFSLILLLIFFIYIVCYMPNLFNHADNYIKANPMSTPSHIVPEWYFLPFYAVLRAISDKSIGIILFGISLGIFFLLPILNKPIKLNFVDNYSELEIYFCGLDFYELESKLFNKLLSNSIISYIYCSIEYISLKLNKEIYLVWFYSNTLLYRQIFWILVVVFFSLGYIGQLEVNTVTIELGQDFTLLYFLIILMLSLTDRIFLIIFGFIVCVMYYLGLFYLGFFSNIEIPAPKFLNASV
jgi:quinol-cytochrome oxidoreductase complex cytochrome b subunit